MNLKLLRISTGPESTLGALYVDGEFECWTLEDTARAEKIRGETRIPTGTYPVSLRRAGKIHEKYLGRYPAEHRGMIWIKGVPNFEYIYIHRGNTKDHTDGCPLVGDAVNNNQMADGFLSKSANAYKRIYPGIARAILNGEAVTIEIAEA